MHEICLYGRGGQGVVTAAEIISESLALNGKYIASFPMFGVERRGAPVTAFVRFDDRPIRIKSRIYHPDCILLFDPKLLRLTDIYGGVKTGSIMVANAKEMGREELHINVSTLGLVDATRIGVMEMGSPIVNTCMIGALAAVTGWISIESILLAIAGRYKNELRTKNQRCASAGFKGVKTKYFSNS